MMLKRFLLKLRIPFTIIVLFFVVIFVFPFPAVGKTLLLAAEVVPQVPFKPLKLVTRAPIVESVKIKTLSGEVDADLYRPNDGRKHPAATFTIGIGITRKEEQVVRMSEALARLGFVVLTPDISDLLSGFVWRDSVETLTASVQYLDRQEFVDNKRIGFAGFCVGSSASILAAENPVIADKVSFITAISPYFDMRTGAEAVVTGHAKNSNGDLVAWKPSPISTGAVVRGFVNAVDDKNEQEILRDHFLDRKILDYEQVKDFSPGALAIYNFLSNTDPAKSEEVWNGMPEDYKNMIIELSPSTRIDNLKAKLIVLNDKKDTFVPKIEGEKLALSVPKDKIYFIEVDSFEHVNPSTKLQRWAAIKALFQLGNYLYKVLSVARIN